MARPSSCQSSTTQTRNRGRFFRRIGDTNSDYDPTKGASSDTSDLYIEDEEIGNASMSQESTEFAVSLSPSAEISTTEMLQFRKSRVPSWSDSSGSTYVSGELQTSPQHTFQQSTKRSDDERSTSDSNDLDILLKSPDGEQRKKEGWKKRTPRLLEGIPSYPAVQEATSNTDLSAIESLQKETARSIFCKRMVPLEISEKASYEEISAVSIAEDPPEKVLSARYKTHPEHIGRLANVDYLPVIEVAADNEDISTVAYRMPYNIAHEAFGHTKTVDDTSMELPRLIIHSSSHSTVSSIDSNSDVESEDDSYGDVGSNEAIRQPQVPSGRTSSKPTRHDDRIRDIEKGLSPKNSDTSSSDARIRDLKKKIEKLRNGPLLQRERPTKHGHKEIQSNCREALRMAPRGRNRSVSQWERPMEIIDKARQSHRIEGSPMKAREENRSEFHGADLISKRIDELTLATKEKRRRRAANYVDDTTGGLAHNFNYKHLDGRQGNSDFNSSDVKISKNSNSLTFGGGEFPIVVDHARQDDISTINDNPASRHGSDIETALRVALDRKEKRNTLKSKEARKKLQGVVIDYFSRGKEFVSNAMKESPKGEHQSSLQQTWKDCMEGRGAGEKVLIVAVSIALVVLFILLIVVLAGR